MLVGFGQIKLRLPSKIILNPNALPGYCDKNMNL
jgi:hypothetical protein